MQSCPVASAPSNLHTSDAFTTTMALKIKLSLHGSRPVVSRTVALDPSLDIYDAALVFVTAIGWRGGRKHYFIIDDGSEDPQIIDRDMEDEYTVGDLRDMNATFYYDPFASWRVDMEFKGESDADSPKVLAWHGECPNQLLAGIRDFNNLRKAAKDPSDLSHDQAAAWLATVPPYDMDEVNRRLGEGEVAFPPYRFVSKNPTDPSVTIIRIAARLLERSLAGDPGFRCPECGAGCDGRMNFDLPPGMIQGVEEQPVTIVCPRCRTESVLYRRNDGYRIGFHEKESSRPQDQQSLIYDMLSRKDDPRDPFEEAGYQAKLGLLYYRYDYRRDNSDAISRCLDGLDKGDPRYGGLSVLCRESLMLLAVKDLRGDSPDVPVDDEGFTGTIGAMAIMEKCLSKGRLEEGDRAIAERARKMMESDPEACLSDRCRVAGFIAIVAHNLDDCSNLSWAASVLEDAASEAEECAESLESLEWWALCYLMESVVGGFYSMDRFTEADKALKCMTGPFVDFCASDVPPAVRNLVMFRRAMLFLSTGGDEGQALDDLDAIITSAKSGEDNGLYTMMRIVYAILLRAEYGATKGELYSNERALSLEVLFQLLSGDHIGEKDVNMALSDYIRIYVGRGYPFSRACEDLRKHGVMLDKKQPDLGEFDIDAVWSNGLSWRV